MEYAYPPYSCNDLKAYSREVLMLGICIILFPLLQYLNKTIRICTFYICSSFCLTDVDRYWVLTIPRLVDWKNSYLELYSIKNGKMNSNACYMYIAVQVLHVKHKWNLKATSLETAEIDVKFLSTVFLT